jgi:Tol biopolymer transport system component
VGPLGWAPDGASLLVIGCRPCNKAETPTQKQTAHHAHIYIVPLDGSPWQELLDLDNGQINAQWSPDGTRLAVERYICAKGSFMPRCDPIEATSSLSVLTLADGVETRLGSTPGITGTAWSPDGTRIAYGDLDGAFVVDAATGATAKLADGQCFGAHWSPDGAWLIVDLSHGDSFTNYDIWIVRSDGSQLHQLVAGYAGASW